MGTAGLRLARIFLGFDKEERTALPQLWGLMGFLTCRVSEGGALARQRRARLSWLC